MATYRIKRFSSQQIRLRRPYIEIAGSQTSSSSSYDSEDPENNYHYESSKGYHDSSSQNSPDEYEEEIIDTPRVSVKRENSTPSFKEKVEKLIKEKSGMSKKDFLQKLGLSVGGATVGTLVGEKIKDQLKEAGLL